LDPELAALLSPNNVKTGHHQQQQQQPLFDEKYTLARSPLPFHLTSQVRVHTISHINANSTPAVIQSITTSF
jgi:hypothetical protein